MKDIGQFCGRTTVGTTSKINKIKMFQKSKTKQGQFKANKTEIQRNGTAAKKFQQQCKMKKLKNVKYKLKNSM